MIPEEKKGFVFSLVSVPSDNGHDLRIRLEGNHQDIIIGIIEACKSDPLVEQLIQGLYAGLAAAGMDHLKSMVNIDNATRIDLSTKGES